MCTLLKQSKTLINKCDRSVYTHCKLALKLYLHSKVEKVAHEFLEVIKVAELLKEFTIKQPSLLDNKMMPF